MSDSPNAKDRALAALTPPSTYLPASATASGASVVGAGEFVAGSVFAGRYRMVAPLRRGPLGEVWHADDLILQAPVALKLLTGAVEQSRILEEVRLARQVTHPAVCRVFDVGEADGRVFYSMELVEGENLETLLRRAGRLPVEKVIDIGGQLCDALAAAHAQHVLHLNLSLSNVLIDADGFIRITDFGGCMDCGTDADCRDYLAPEQCDCGAPAGTVSERSDLYAVGVILYELLVGRPVTNTPRPNSGRWPRPSRDVPEISGQLDRVILDALARDPQKRPASAAIMAERLRDSVGPASRPRGWVVAALVMAVALVAGAIAFFYPRTAALLSDRDTMVVADFVNSTGEPVFDRALKVALAVALEQSPFLQVFPDERVHDTLRLMERSPDERITREVAREIAVRERLKALVAGSIARLGSHYVLTLEAINAQSSDIIAREQVEIANREQVLTALGSAASRLRGRLGESLASVRRFDVPLARATTGSLEALNAYSLALDNGRVNLRAEAIPHLQRAIELDPEFALAYALMSGVYANIDRRAEAPQYARRAFELRDRVSERERFFISWRYYIDSAQAWDQALALATLWARTYPREPFAFNSLGMSSAAFGRHEPAVDAFRTAIGLDRRFLPPHGNLVGSLIAMGRFEDARVAILDARTAGIDAVSLDRATYLLAFLSGDETAMTAALAAARAKSATALPSLNWEARTAAFGGQIRAAHDLFARGVREADSANLHELAAQWLAEDAEAHALTGECATARTEVSAALARGRDNFTLERSARTLAFCGEDPTSLSAELWRRFPDATLTRQIHVPVIDAVAALRRDPGRAIERLEPVRSYDNAPAAEFWPAYIRGSAYLALRDGPRAATEFQRILDRRGVGPASLLYPLATLGSARAAALTGDTARSRRAFEAFFQLWRNADALAPMGQARREFEALR